MTTVSLIVPPRTWTDKVEEDGKKSEPESPFANNNETTFVGILIDDEVEPRRKMTEGLQPLLTSMKIFGLYFDPPSKDAGNEKSRKWNAYRIYAVTVVILSWINAVRIFSVFTREDSFGLALFNKLLAVSFFVQCAVSQTTFFAASYSGRLAVVLDQVLDDPCVRHARKFSVAYAALAWGIIMTVLTFYTYGLLFTDGSSDYYLAPLQIHVAMPNPLIPRLIASGSFLHMLSAYTFSQATTFVLAMVFSHQFRKVSETLERFLVSDGKRRAGLGESDIEMLRQQHQQISMNISHVDDCLMFANASAFCCQVFTLVILLYSLIFYHSLVADAVVITGYLFKMLAVSFGLVLTAAGGITVHHYVSVFTHNT